MVRRFALVLTVAGCVLSSAAPAAYASPAPAEPSAITRRWQDLGGTSSFLGAPVGAERPGPLPGTRMGAFVGGSLYADGSTARLLYGAIGERFRTLPAQEQAALGVPVTDEQDGWRPGSRMNRFAGGTIHFSPGTGAQVVRGQIDRLYSGDAAVRRGLGLPIGGETDGYAGARVSAFEGGEIYWTPTSGANAVYGVIGDRYRELQLVLGLPRTSETAGRVPGSRVSAFTNGDVYFSVQTGAHEVYGVIGERYRQLGAEASELGLPITGEQPVPEGRASDFQFGRIVFDGARTRVELTTGPESSPLWTECRLELDGVQVTWPANNHSLTVLRGSGTGARLQLLVRRNSACGYERVVDSPARVDPVAPGTYPLAEARVGFAHGAAPRATYQHDGPEGAVLSVEGAGSVSMGAAESAAVLRSVRPQDTLVVAG